MTIELSSTDQRSVKALAILGQAHTWTHGTRKSDGLAFAVVPASKPGHTYYVSELGCTCPDATRRGGVCKHRTAYRLWQVQHGQASAPAGAAAPERPCTRCAGQVRGESIYSQCDDCTERHGWL